MGILVLEKKIWLLKEGDIEFSEYIYPRNTTKHEIRSRQQRVTMLLINIIQLLLVLNFLIMLYQTRVRGVRRKIVKKLVKKCFKMDNYSKLGKFYIVRNALYG